MKTNRKKNPLMGNYCARAGRSLGSGLVLGSRLALNDRTIRHGLRAIRRPWSGARC